ncbi:hypothetical protein D3C76_283750 [compost metagenome]
MTITKDAHFYATARISENIVTTPEGFLLCIGVPIARTGELLYAEGELLTEDGTEVIEPVDGRVNVMRDGDALFAPSAMASFEGKSITIGHPQDFVSPLNWMQVSVGHMQNVRRGTGEDGDKLIADLLIKGQQAIDMVKAGLREVSLGYDAAYEQTKPGYGVQTGIVGNHVALVRKGRNGSEVAVRDSAPEFKPKGTIMSAKEKLMKLLGRAIDEALPEEQKPEGEGDAPSMDARMAKIEDLLTKLADAGNTTDATPPPQEEAPKDPLEARLDAIEAAIAKLLEMKSGEVVDEAPAPKTEDENGVVMCTDAETISRAEVLVPGIANSATLIKDALDQFGKTTDGAAVLKTFDSIKDETALFTAAAEVMKVSRSVQLAPPKAADFATLRAGTADGKGPMSPEAINAANAKRYGSN